MNTITLLIRQQCWFPLSCLSGWRQLEGKVSCSRTQYGDKIPMQKSYAALTTRLSRQNIFTDCIAFRDVWKMKPAGVSEPVSAKCLIALKLLQL